MQKVIIPALALLIGMALGALLMKNSCVDSKKTTFDQAIDIVANEINKNNFVDANKNSEYLLIDPKTKDTVVKKDTKLAKLYSSLNNIFFIPSCNEGSANGISIAEADGMIQNYYDSDLFRVKNRCKTTSSGDVCESGRLAGWSFDREVFDKLLGDVATQSFSQINLFLARRNSDTGIGPLTLVMIPSVGDNLIAKDGLMFEYARPCPPKCKTKILIGENTSPKEVECDTNPFK